MQMRIDCDHAIEIPGESTPDDALAYRLPCMERRILAHIAKIGCNESQSLRAELQRRCRGELELDELVIRIIEASAKNDVVGQIRRQSNETFAIRKLMNRNGRITTACMLGQPSGRLFVLGKSQE